MFKFVQNVRKHGTSQFVSYTWNIFFRKLTDKPKEDDETNSSNIESDDFIKFDLVELAKGNKAALPVFKENHSNENSDSKYNTGNSEEPQTESGFYLLYFI